MDKYYFVYQGRLCGAEVEKEIIGEVSVNKVKRQLHALDQHPPIAFTQETWWHDCAKPTRAQLGVADFIGIKAVSVKDDG